MPRPFPPGSPRLKLVLLLLLALAVAACGRGEPAADFSMTLFQGGEFQLSEVTREQAVVVNFWYPSCPPCREEMPHFEAAWQEFQGRDVRFLGVFVPQGFDTEEDARRFVAELGLTFDFGTDQQARIAEAYGLQFFPTTYFISRGGRVFSVEIASLDTETITGIVEAMLDG